MNDRMARGTFALSSSALLALALLGASPAAMAGDDAWKVKWDNGFKFDSPDGDFKLKFGGRLQADWSFTDVDDEIAVILGDEQDEDGTTVFVTEDVVDGNEFRRARLFVSGTVYDRVEFKVQYDFAGGDADFKDAYIGIKDTPVGNIRIGHFKEPFSLEQLTSSKFITFMEPSLPDAFAPGRNTGVMLFDHPDERWTWAVGAFRDSNGFGNTSDGEGKLNLTGRVTGLPIYEDGGERLVHVGLSASEVDLGDDAFDWDSRPENHLTPAYVDTGDFTSEGASLYNVEVAGVFGRFWFAAEHSMADMDAAPFGNPSFSGGYYQFGVFLTEGDRRSYKTSAGTFDRQKPSRRFGKEGGPGAWEIALRISDLDLNDEGLSGGELDNMSLAVNWYLNPVTRLMLNYVTSDLTRTVDFADTIGVVSVNDAGSDFWMVRMQIDF